MSDAVLNRAVDALVREYRPDKVIVFGSVARGEAGEDSDLDLLVVKSGVGHIRPHDRHCEVIGIVPHEVGIDALVYTPEELERRVRLGDPFVKSVLSEGRVVYAA